MTYNDCIWLRRAGVNELAMHAIERSTRVCTNLQSHVQSRTFVVFETGSDQGQLMRPVANVLCKHLAVAFEATAGEDHIRRST